MYLIIVLPVAMVSLVVTHLSENWILKGRIKINEVAQLCLFATPWTVAHHVLPSMAFFQAGVLEQVAISFSRGSF